MLRWRPSRNSPPAVHPSPSISYSYVNTTHNLDLGALEDIQSLDKNSDLGKTNCLSWLIMTLWVLPGSKVFSLLTARRLKHIRGQTSYSCIFTQLLLFLALVSNTCSYGFLTYFKETWVMGTFFLLCLGTGRGTMPENTLNDSARKQLPAASSFPMHSRLW